MTDQYGNLVLSDYYHSNCLIEAIRAKIQHPDVRIIMCHPKGAILPHFLWKYEGDDALYDFGTNHTIVTSLWYEGYVRQRKEAAHGSLRT